MERINCYGKENKRKLIEQYTITPILYLGLLENQEKEGCCGKLKDRYYIFKAINKEAKEELSFYAGKHCAEEILKLLQLKPLPFFNPLRIQNRNDNERNHIGYRDNSIGHKKLHQLNEDLINAITIISIAWNKPLPFFILKIIEFTRLLDEKTINSNGIKWVNKCLEKDKKGRTLSQILIDLREENPDLRDFNFNRLSDFMDEEFKDETNRY